MRHRRFQADWDGEPCASLCSRNSTHALNLPLRELTTSRPQAPIPLRQSWHWRGAADGRDRRSRAAAVALADQLTAFAQPNPLAQRTPLDLELPSTREIRARIADVRTYQREPPCSEIDLSAGATLTMGCPTLRGPCSVSWFIPVRLRYASMTSTSSGPRAPQRRCLYLHAQPAGAGRRQSASGGRAT